ncbi:stage V sporulation protein B [Kyrpidia spormannii]|uniref:Stage V sporulation protein B n=2 Tax=Kyrpidia spormannii TaxID=2055160 RepID=A0A2K8N9D6_9BACL|nr:stage V sporulation protein B [Kyrpidia spormannii]
MGMGAGQFFRGALILTVAALITRVMGFVYRFFLANLIHDQGMGLFQTVSPLLSFVLTLTTLSLSTAVSKCVAEAAATEDTGFIQRVLLISFGVVTGLSAAGTLALLAAAPWLARTIFHNPDTYPLLVAMLPLIPIISIASVVRGYLQGLQHMNPLAVSVILEQTIRIGSVYWLIGFALPYGLPYAVAAAMVGSVLGELSGLLFLLWRARPLTPTGTWAVWRHVSGQRSSTRSAVRALQSIAIPVTASRLLGSFAYALEPVFVHRSLIIAGMTASMATAFYGQYAGMAAPLILLPTVVTYSLSTALVPAVSEAAAEQRTGLIRRRLSQALRISAIIGFPTSAWLYLFAEPLSEGLYHNASVAVIVKQLAPVGFLLYLQAPLASILQGLDRADLAMRNSIAGSVLRLGLIWWLASQSAYHILGVLWAVVASICFTTLLHSVSLGRLIGFPIPAMDLVKIALATFGTYAWMSYVTLWTQSPWAEILLSATLGAAVYTALLMLLGVVHPNSLVRLIRAIPRGPAA